MCTSYTSRFKYDCFSHPDQVRALSKEWADRAALPGHVVTMLNNFPSNLHPMSQFTAAIAALNSESKFAKAYADGIHKSKYWEVITFFS